MPDEARRPKRQCARAARAVTALPSVAHYVGYVEDNETPEQIMKKFETMEKVKTRRGADATAALRARDGRLAGHGTRSRTHPGLPHHICVFFSR